MIMNRSIRFILKIYLLALSVFSVFRIILFLSEFDRIDGNEVAVTTIVKSFIMGVRFDVVISGVYSYSSHIDLFNIRGYPL